LFQSAEISPFLFRIFPERRKIARRVLLSSPVALSWLLEGEDGQGQPRHTQAQSRQDA
jgi:hypothetical protein